MTTVAEIREYLLLLGWSEKQLQSQRPWNDFEKLEKLANERAAPSVTPQPSTRRLRPSWRRRPRRRGKSGKRNSAL